MQNLLSPSKAAGAIGAREKTLANWRTQGVGPKFIKAGRKVLYDPADIADWKDANRYSSTSEAA